MSSPDLEITLDATMAQGADLISVAREMSSEGSAAPPSLPGYSLQGRLGAGTFGEAWSGIQLSTGQKVAVKLFSRHQSMDWSLFRAEVHRLMEVAEHPNVVTLLDANLENTPPFFVMPLMASSLADRTKVSGAQMAIWLEEVCQGLGYIHQKGILHGDLKPANLLLDHEGRVRLADFGQSFATEAGGYNLGTLGYMPPEQVARALEHSQAEPSPSWDVYALGATAYRLLTGQVPRLEMRTRSGLTTWTMHERLKLALEVSQTPLVPLRSLNPEVDSELAAIVEGCLEPLGDFRYPNTQAVLDELRRRKESMPLRVKRPWGIGYQLRLLLRRNPGAVVVGSVLMLVLMASVALGWREVGLERAKLSQQQQALDRATKDLESKAEELQREQKGVHLLERSLGFQAQDQGHLGQAILWWARALGHDPQSKTLGYLVGSYAYPLRLYVRPSGPCLGLSLSSQGQSLAYGLPGGEVQVYFADGKSLKVQHPPEVSSLSLSPEGQQLLTSGTSGQVLGWSLSDTLKPLFQDWLIEPTYLTSLSLPPARRRCSLVAFSRDGKQRLIASQDGQCQLLPARIRWRIDGTPVRASFTRDGRYLTMLSRTRRLTIWSNQGRLLREVSATDGCLDESGRRLAWVDESGQIWQQELQGGPLLRLGTGSQVAFVGSRAVTDGWIASPDSLQRFSGNGRRLAVVRGRRLQIYDSLRRIPASGELLHGQPIRQLALSFDGQQVATDDGHLRWFDAHMGGGWRARSTLPGQRLLLGPNRLALQEGDQVVLRDGESGKELSRQPIRPGYGWAFQGRELVVNPHGPVAWLPSQQKLYLAEGQRVLTQTNGQTQGQLEARSRVLGFTVVGGALAIQTRQGLQVGELTWDGTIEQCKPFGDQLLVGSGRSLLLLGLSAAKNQEQNPERRIEQKGKWTFPAPIRELHVGGLVLLVLGKDGVCQVVRAHQEFPSVLIPGERLGNDIERAALSPDGQLAAVLTQSHQLKVVDISGPPVALILPPELSHPEAPVRGLQVETSQLWLGTEAGWQNWGFDFSPGNDLKAQAERWTGLRLGPTGQCLTLSPEQWSPL